MKPLSPFAGDWSALSPLLDEALSLQPLERAAWLDRLGGEQALHRDALRALLQHQKAVETDDFLGGGLPALGASATVEPGPVLDMGSCIGPYRLIAELGQGGMATVWLAERADGSMARRVALKLPRIVWGANFIERLHRERQILATLEHEHIARLYDAGVDSQGRPFLAMEYVEGVPIDTYCREHALSVRQRIELLLQVIAAVAHAHAKLVVHRDLKPGNILVTKNARVHLLDFGIAKLLQGDVTSQTALTELGGRALTLDYASPEQIRGEPLGTASDVYSLAVVAYELLAGRRPYRMKRASAAELEEAIANVQPPLASSTATDRRTSDELRGDIDSILNKALKKLPGERYPTMEAYGRELRRYLAGEPVEARPDLFFYRARKFVHRHRLQVGAGAVALVALVGGTSVALWQAHEAKLSASLARSEAARAQVESATAKAVQRFVESVFNANSRFQVDPRASSNATARELLDRGAERIDKELASQPEAQLRLYDVLAEMYAGMALHERGLTLYRQALALATRIHGPSSDSALLAAANIGQTLDDLGRYDEALAILLEADRVAAGRASDRDAIRMTIDTDLAHIYFHADTQKGLVRARRAASIARQLGPSFDGITALSVLGDLARKSGQLVEARQALSDAILWVDAQGALGVLPNILGSFGDVQDELGQIEQAGLTMTRSISVAAQLGDGRSLHIARYKLARYQYDNRLLREALDTASSELDWARSPGGDPWMVNLRALTMANYGRTLVAYGDAERGLLAVDTALALIPPGSTPQRGQMHAARADALISMGRLVEAAPELERAEAATSNAGIRIVELIRAIRRRYLVAAGEADEALRNLATHPMTPGELLKPNVQVRRQTEEAELMVAAGHDADARTVTATALAALGQLPERRFERDVEARLTAVLGKALLHEGRPTEALPTLGKALTLHLAQYDPERSPAVAKVRQSLAEAERLAKH